MLSEEENKSVSHEDVNDKLRQKELEESQKLVKFIADKFQSFGKPLQPGPYSMYFELKANFENLLKYPPAIFLYSCH